MPYIFRSSIRVDGKRIFAKDYKKKAFRIWVEDETRGDDLDEK